MSLLWINGALRDKLDAHVSPFDHGFLYGDGVWEHLRLFGGRPFGAGPTLKRLATAAAALGLEVPLSEGELLAAIGATAQANARTEGYCRVFVTRGPGTVGPDPRKIEPQVLVSVEEYQPFPHELVGHGLHAVTAPDPLDWDNPAHRFRTLNGLHLVRAKQFALRNGCLEALLATRGGHIAGATEGIVFARKGDLLTAAETHWWEEAGTAVGEVVGNDLALVQDPLRADDLLAADEVFLAGTACGVVGLVRLNGQVIGSGTEGPVTRAARDGYARLVGAAV